METKPQAAQPDEDERNAEDVGEVEERRAASDALDERLRVEAPCVIGRIDQPRPAKVRSSHEKSAAKQRGHEEYEACEVRHRLPFLNHCAAWSWLADMGIDPCDFIDAV